MPAFAFMPALRTCTCLPWPPCNLQAVAAQPPVHDVVDASCMVSAPAPSISGSARIVRIRGFCCRLCLKERKEEKGRGRTKHPTTLTVVPLAACPQRQPQHQQHSSQMSHPTRVSASPLSPCIYFPFFSVSLSLSWNHSSRECQF